MLFSDLAIFWFRHATLLWVSHFFIYQPSLRYGQPFIKLLNGHTCTGLGRAGLARDGARGALRRGAEAGRGGVMWARCAGALVWARGLGLGRADSCEGSRGGVGVGVDQLVAWLDWTRGWLVQVMDLRVHHPRWWIAAPYIYDTIIHHLDPPVQPTDRATQHFHAWSSGARTCSSRLTSVRLSTEPRALR
jgi:hypothetical protein